MYICTSVKRESVCTYKIFTYISIFLLSYSRYMYIYFVVRQLSLILMKIKRNKVREKNLPHDCSMIQFYYKLNSLRTFINMLNNIGKAVDSIFHKPDSIFVKAKAKDILFDGLPVDCTVKDFAGSAACNVLKTEAKDLVPDGEDRYKFSLFGGVGIVLILKQL